MYPGIHLLLYSCLAALVFLMESVPFHLVTSACIVSALFFMPFRKVRGGFVPIMLFLSFTFISNLFYQSGEVVADLGPVTVTDEGLRIASLRMLRVFDLVYAAKILTHFTPIEAMIASLRKTLRPLELIGIPVHYFFSVTALTLQCFPVMKKKLYDKYSEAIKQRAVTPSGGTGVRGLMSSAGLIASFMIPLFVESMAEPERFFQSAHITTDDTLSD
ncbi:MAG: hypothetical protein HQL08_14950 [Nitrospirae bacterium]|nr:hypothetical protein [Nitrospirota bacterium]